MKNLFEKIKSFFTKNIVQTSLPKNVVQTPPLFDNLFDLAASNGHIRLSADQALQQETVFACVQLISSSIAQLPLFLYKKTEKGRQIALDHPLYTVLHERPNEWQTPISFIEFLVSNMLLTGIAAAYIVKVGGKIKSLIPIAPQSLSEYFDEQSGEHYFYADVRGTNKLFKADELLVCKGLSLDGKTAISPIRYAASLINTNLRALNYSSNFYKNGARPAGILTTAEALDVETIENIKNNWNSAYGGANSGKTAVLSGGMEYKPISMTNSDAQLLEIMGYNRNQIAALFGVPPYMVGGVETSSSWGTGIEQQRLNMLTFTLTPWVKRIQQAMMRDLLTPSERRTLYIEFLTEGFLSTDTMSRYNAYKIALGGTQAPGFMTQNEVRIKENLSILKGGDVLYQPVKADEEIKNEEGSVKNVENS